MFSTFVRYYHFVTNSLTYQSGNPGRCIAPYNILKCLALPEKITNMEKTYLIMTFEQRFT